MQGQIIKPSSSFNSQRDGILRYQKSCGAGTRRSFNSQWDGIILKQATINAGFAICFNYQGDRLPAQFILIKYFRFTSPILLSRSAEFTLQDKFRRILFHSLYFDLAFVRADFDPIAGFDLVA